MLCCHKPTVGFAVATLDDDIKSLEDVVNGDWGPSNVFWSLKGESFEETFGQYTCVMIHAAITFFAMLPTVLSHSQNDGSRYKLKPYDKVEQDYTSLGNWDKYTKTTDGYAFKFTGGQSCWNGPQRSATVLVSCVSTAPGRCCVAKLLLEVAVHARCDLM